MKTFVLALLSATVIASALAALLLAVAPALSKRYSARAVSAAFLIVLVSFLAVWSPKVKAAAITVPMPQAKTVLTVPMSIQARMEQNAAKMGGADKIESAARTNTAAPAQTTRTLDTYDVIFILWAVGALAALYLHTLKHARFLRAVRRWKRPAPDAYRRALNEAAYEMNLRRIPSIAVCPVADGPMLYGLKKPCVLVPEADMPRAALLPILRHELMHFRRRDLLRRLLTLPVLIAQWFNPFAYLAARGQAFYAEIACDENATAGEPFTARRDYAQVILYSIRGHGARSALSTGFKGGKKQMKKRIEAVLSGKTKRVGRVLVLLMLSAALLLTGAFALTEAQETDTKAIAERAKAQYSMEYGDFFLWPASVKGAYAIRCEEAGIETDDGVKYLWWEGNDIQYADAMNIVRREMGAEDIEDIFYVGTSIYLKDDMRVLKIELKPMANTEKDCDCYFLMEAASGRVISASMADGAADAARAAKANMDAAVEKTRAALTGAYGENQTYWPISAKAELYHAGDAYKLDMVSEAFSQEVPGADDLTEAQAREIADNYFKETFGMLPQDVEGREVKCGARFLVQQNDTTKRCYVFTYASDEGTEKYIDYGEIPVLSPSGEVSFALYYGFVNTRALEVTDTPRSERAKKQYTGEYGDFFLWPASIKAAYTDRCVEEGKLPEDGNRYLEDTVTDLSEESVLVLVSGELGIDEPTLSASFQVSLGILEENGVRFYLVKLRASAPTEADTDCTLKIATPSGKILEKNVPDGATEAAMAAMEKRCGEETAFYQTLTEQYGDEMLLWPLEAKKQYSDFHNPNPTLGTLMDSLPTGDDLTPEQAMAIADAKFQEIFGVSPKDGLKTEKNAYTIQCGVSFYVEALNETTGRYYLMTYLAALNGAPYMGLGEVWIYSPGGEVMRSNLSRESFSAFEANDEAQKKVDEKTAKDGMWVNWPLAEIQEHADALGFTGYTLAQEGGAGQLTRDSAIAIARQHVLENYPEVRSQIGYKDGFQKLTKEIIDGYKVCAFLATSTESGEAPYWQVYLYDDAWLAEGVLDTFDIRIDAVTGVVLYGFEPGGNG